MDPIFMNTKNSETKESYVFKSQITSKIDLRTSPKRNCQI